MSRRTVEVSEGFDSPDSDDVLQENEIDLATPVREQGIVRVDELPTGLVSCRNILLPAGTRAIKVLSEDPRRRACMLWPSIALDTEATKIMIGLTEADVNAFAGAILESGANAIARWPFNFADELWAMPLVINDTNGIFTGFAVSTDDIFLSIVSENWAR